MTDNVAKRGFKRKTIVEAIEKKVFFWLKTIDDKELREEILKSFIVTGGAITSMLQGELPNDYDIYFTNNATALKVAEYYIKKLEKTENDKVKIEAVERGDQSGIEVRVKSMGVVGADTNIDSYGYFEALPVAAMEKFIKENLKRTKEKYGLALMSSNAISLNDSVQLITRFTGDPRTIHENYDFVHCTNYYSRETGLVLQTPALESILSKELKYVGSRYPICSLFRIKKFVQRGWTITAGEMLKIVWDVKDLDLSDMNVLQDQLVGVDSAYFSQLLTELNTKDKNIDRTYLFEVINRVFDSYDLDKLVFPDDEDEK